MSKVKMAKIGGTHSLWERHGKQTNYPKKELTEGLLSASKPGEHTSSSASRLRVNTSIRIEMIKLVDLICRVTTVIHTHTNRPLSHPYISPAWIYVQKFLPTLKFDNHQATIEEGPEGSLQIAQTFESLPLKLTIKHMWVKWERWEILKGCSLLPSHFTLSLINLKYVNRFED